MMLPTLLEGWVSEGCSLDGGWTVSDGMRENLPIPNQIQRSHSRLLRVPRHVTANQRQERHERRRRRLREVVARETPAVVSERQADDQRHADDGDNEP